MIMKIIHVFSKHDFIYGSLKSVIDLCHKESIENVKGEKRTWTPILPVNSSLNIRRIKMNYNFISAAIRSTSVTEFINFTRTLN